MSFRWDTDFASLDDLFSSWSWSTRQEIFDPEVKESQFPDTEIQLRKDDFKDTVSLPITPVAAPQAITAIKNPTKPIVRQIVQPKEKEFQSITKPELVSLSIMERVSLLYKGLTKNIQQRIATYKSRVTEIQEKEEKLVLDIDVSTLSKYVQMQFSNWSVLSRQSLWSIVKQKLKEQGVPQEQYRDFTNKLLSAKQPNKNILLASFCLIYFSRPQNISELLELSNISDYNEFIIAIIKFFNWKEKVKSFDFAWIRHQMANFK